ncbi:MAG: RNA polymerase sigma-70 factor [Cyclobacteriaceae bacterium]
MTPADEKALFDLAKHGDIKAFEKLFKKHYADVVRFATSMVRDRTIGEEIGQEIFMYLWEKREQIHLKSSLKSYLFSSTKNKCINYFKLELPKQQALTDLVDIEDAHESPMTSDEHELMKLKVQNAIDTLPGKCRNIFVLSRYGGMTYQEIADDLGISIKTVENQISIALKKLKEQLSEELKGYNIK